MTCLSIAGKVKQKSYFLVKLPLFHTVAGSPGS